MRQFWLLLAACALCVAAEPEYRARRDALAKALPDGVIVAYGQTDVGEENLRTGFFQTPDFLYLTGWNAPGAILLIAPERQTLFIPARDLSRERWTGVQPAPGDPEVERRSGFASIAPADTFEKELRAATALHPKLYAADAQSRAKLRGLSPAPREILSAEPQLARLRMKKTPRELGQLQRAADASVAAHLTAWKRAAPGVFEYQVAAAAISAFMDLGCERTAYAPVAGSGPNSVYLHYSRNTRRMAAGDLLLLDAGAECGGYAADITRTAPVSGEFTGRQRELYNVVLGAEQAVIAAIKPGAYIGGRNRPSLQQIAADYINAHGKDLHGEPLGKYFTHGISHHIGLSVHDLSDNSAPLEEGMVISVEPGVYIPEEGIGIRIEDMVQVTKDGARVMTAALPREAADVERAVRK